MVSRRETIKGFALACMRFAHYYHPSGDDAYLSEALDWNPKVSNQAHLKSSILTAVKRKYFIVKQGSLTKLVIKNHIFVVNFC